MKKLLLTLALFLLPSLAMAQCNGVFPNGTVCGNTTGATNTPRPVTLASIGLPVSIITLGGVADSSSAYNTTNATTNASVLSANVGSGKCIFFPFNTNGYSLLAETVSLNAGQCIVGENQVTIKSQPTSGQWVIHLIGQELFSGPAIIQNLTFNLSGSISGSTAIRFATASQLVYGVQISQLLCLNTFECIGDETSASNYVFDVKLYDIRAILTQGRSFHISRSRGYMWIDTIRVDQQEAGQTAPAPWHCGEFDDMIGLEINRWDCVGPTTALGGSYSSGFYGLLINGAGSGEASVWLNRILIDSYSNDGIKVANLSYLQANWLESFQSLGVPLTLSAIQKSNISNTLTVGGQGLTGAASSAPGITCTGCIVVNFNGVVTYLNTGAGILVNGASNQVAITGIQSFSNTGFGLTIADTANLVTFDNGGISGNTAGPVSNTSSGTANRITNLAGYNPIGSVAAASVGTSPALICAGADTVTDYLFQSATNTATILSGSNQVQTLNSNSQFYPVNLNPGECYTVVWTATQPTFTRVKH